MIRLETIFLLFFAVLLSACSNKTSVPDQDRFTGTWKLYQIQKFDSTKSKWTKAVGELNYTTGYLIYDGQGGMGVHEVLENYEDYDFQGTQGISSYTDQDLQHLAGNFVYFGRYKILSDKEIIQHSIKTHINPALWNTTNQRKYQFSGDTLMLFPMSKEYSDIRVIWTKIIDEN